METNFIMWITLGIIVVALGALYTLTRRKVKPEEAERTAKLCDAPQQEQAAEVADVTGNETDNASDTEETTSTNDDAAVTEPTAESDTSTTEITPKTTADNVTQKKMPAKMCLVENIATFAPLLAKLREGKMDEQAWIEAIVGTENEELLRYWRKIKGQAAAWKTILQMWGIKDDACSQLVAMKAHEEMYECEDGTALIAGKNYTVKTPCWILTTTNADGKTVKKVIVKGKCSDN